MDPNAGANQMTDAEKQIAMRAYMDRGGTGDLRERLFAACEAVLASRAPHDVEKAAEAANTWFMVVACTERPLEPTGAVAGHPDGTQERLDGRSGSRCPVPARAGGGATRATRYTFAHG